MFLVTKNQSNSDEQNLETKSNEKEVKILVERSYINNAWGFQYYGKVICTDGNIYEFEFDEYLNDYYSKDSLDKINKIIMENAKKTGETVSKKDLKNIEKNISKLKDKMEYSDEQAWDMGEFATKTWNYEKDERLVLKEFGDATGENTTQTAKDILDIVDKYFE